MGACVTCRLKDFFLVRAELRIFCFIFLELQLWMYVLLILKMYVQVCGEECMYFYTQEMNLCVSLLFTHCIHILLWQSYFYSMLKFCENFHAFFYSVCYTRD